jgi:hypothetical protein
MPRLASSHHGSLHLVIGFLSLGCGDSLERPEPKDDVADAAAERDAGDLWEPPSAESQLDEQRNCSTSESDKSARADTVLYGFRAIDFANGMPRNNLQAKACRNSDLRCEQPIATFVDEKGTGQVQLELPNGFIGFIEVTSDAIDALLYLTRPITANTLDRDLAVPAPGTVALFATLLEYPWDMGKGLVTLEVLDCAETPQSGMHFVSDGGGDSFYLVDQVPYKQAELTVHDPVTNTAIGGFINVPPGVVEFSAAKGSEPNAERLGPFQAQVRAGAITVIGLHQ